MNVPAQMDVGETWTYTISYTTTQADVDAGSDLINAVSARTDETGLPQSSTAVTGVSRTPSFDLTKTRDVATLSAPGVITYTVTATNTGNTTLSGIGLLDQLTQGGVARSFSAGPLVMGDTNGDGALDVGETWVYTASFAVTQAEIDDGGVIRNSVSFDSAETPSQSDVVETSVTQSPTLDLTKTIAAGEPSAFSAVGETIDFTFTLTNTGNTTLPAPVAARLIIQNRS